MIKTFESTVHDVCHKLRFLDFKLPPRCDCCIISFGSFSGIRILCADVSEYSIGSIFIVRVDKKNNWDEIVRVCLCVHYVFMWMCVCMYVCVCVCVHACAYMCLCVYVRIYIYTHTYIYR